MNNSLVAGVDIGGSHITAALVDLSKREVLHHTWRRTRIDSMGVAQDILDAWCRVIAESFAVQNIQPTGVGMAMPGPFDYEEGISLMKNQNKYDALYGLNVKTVLSQQLHIGVKDIKITNDAACYLQGEVFGGVAKGYRQVVGLTLGTGLGSARAVNEVAEDANLWCAPFKEGIVEDYLSTRWFVGRYFELTGEQVKDVKELADSYDSNSTIRLVFDEFGGNLGAFLSPLIRKENIELVVLGGNISHAFPLFAESLNKTLAQNHAAIEIKKSVLGENATLIGAASYCCSPVPQPDLAGARL